MKLTKRKGFNFFRSYFDVYNELENDKDKIQFINALLERQFLGIKPTNLKGMSKFAYISQVNNIDSQVKGYEDKTGLMLSTNNPPPTYGGKTPPTYGGEIPPTLQVIEKVIVIEKDIEKVKVKDIEVRKLKFANSLKPFLKTYEENLITDFYKYWTEHGYNDRKMKFEKEKSFGLSQRLSRWKINDAKFNNNKNQKNEQLTKITKSIRDTDNTNY